MSAHSDNALKNDFDEAGFKAALEWYIRSESAATGQATTVSGVDSRYFNFQQPSATQTTYGLYPRFFSNPPGPETGNGFVPGDIHSKEFEASEPALSQANLVSSLNQAISSPHLGRPLPEGGSAGTVYPSASAPMVGATSQSPHATNAASYRSADWLDMTTGLTGINNSERGASSSNAEVTAVTTSQCPEEQGFGNILTLPATIDMFIKGAKLRPLLKNMALPLHWLECIPPNNRKYRTQRQAKGHFGRTIDSPTDEFVAVICGQYRNAILTRIGGREALHAQLLTLGTSLSSVYLYPTPNSDPYLEVLALEFILEPRFNNVPPFFVEIRRVQVLEDGQWIWGLQSTTKEGTVP